MYSTCPDVSISPFKGATQAPPEGTPVHYSALRGLGWGVPASRASTATAATTAANSSDFWSVACQKGVKAERTSCTTANDLAGAVHVRYNCTDASFWVLVYSLADIKYGTTSADMWAANQCGDFCDSKDTAFLRCVREVWPARPCNSCGSSCAVGKAAARSLTASWQRTHGT